jgi:hypothetical protein
VHFSLGEDAAWHSAWTAALLRTAIADTTANAERVSAWVDGWRPLARAAVAALAVVAAEAPEPVDTSALDERVTVSADRYAAEVVAAVAT